MTGGRWYLLGAGTESVVLYCVRERIVKGGSPRWRLYGGAFSGLYAPGPGVGNSCSGKQSIQTINNICLDCVFYRAGIRFSVRAADSAPLEVSNR